MRSRVMRPSMTATVSGRAELALLLAAGTALEVKCVDELLEYAELVVVFGIRDDRRLVQHFLRHQDPGARAHRECDRVRRTRIELDLLATDLEEDAAEERSAALIIGDEIAHHDARDLRADLLQDADHEVVRQRALRRYARELRRDAVCHVRPDPDREQPPAVALLQADDVLAGENVHANGLDDDGHEHRVPILRAEEPSPARAAVRDV